MKITIFTKSNCAYCPMVKKFLDYKKLSYSTVNLDDDPEGIKVLEKLSGYTTVPQTIIEKENHETKVVVGYNLPQLIPALQNA